MLQITVFEICYDLNDQRRSFFMEGTYLCESDACHFAALHAGVDMLCDTAFLPVSRAKIQAEKLGITNVCWALARQFYS